MPRQIALLICCGFVFYLLRCERREFKSISWRLWLPTIWLLITSSRSLDVWLGVTGGSRISGGVLDPIFQTFLICIGLTSAFNKRDNWLKFGKENGILVMLIGYMLISALWSEMPVRSLRSWIKEVVAVLMAMMVLSEPQPRQALQSVLRRFVYIVIPFSVLLVKYYPDLGIVYRRWDGGVQWIGVAIHKSSLGQLCAISAFFLVWTLLQRLQSPQTKAVRRQMAAEGFVLLLTVWLIRGPSDWASSATSVVAVSAGFLLYFALSWMRKHRLQFGAGAWMAVTACIISFGFSTPIVGGSTIVGASSALGRDSTLTGRTEIWAGIVPDFFNSPILGYGLSGFWTPARTSANQVGQAHNGYLEVSLELGLVGLLFIGILLLSWTRKARRTLGRDFDFGCLCSCFLLMLLVVNIAESSINSFTTPTMAIILFLSVAASTSKISRSASRPPAQLDRWVASPIQSVGIT